MNTKTLHLSKPEGYQERAAIRRAFYALAQSTSETPLHELMSLIDSHISELLVMREAKHIDGVWYYQTENNRVMVAFQHKTLEVFPDNDWIDVLSLVRY